METFVLVHGAWDGGYVWKKLAELLRKRVIVYILYINWTWGTNTSYAT